MKIIKEKYRGINSEDEVINMNISMKKLRSRKTGITEIQKYETALLVLVAKCAICPKQLFHLHEDDEEQVKRKQKLGRIMYVDTIQL